MNTQRTLSYSLASAAPAARWAITLFLGTLGIAYAFGALMVIEWVGLSPAAVADVYREGETEPASRRVEGGEQPIDLEQFLGEENVHQIDRRLLVQDTHVHVPVYALIALALAAISLGLEWPRRAELVVVFALFAGPLLDFGGQWLTKLAGGGFAYVTLAGGWLMAASYLTVAGNAVWQMWFRTDGRRSEQ